MWDGVCRDRCPTAVTVTLADDLTALFVINQEQENVDNSRIAPHIPLTDLRICERSISERSHSKNGV
jgi:hypothetical protein